MLYSNQTHYVYYKPSHCSKPNNGKPRSYVEQKCVTMKMCLIDLLPIFSILKKSEMVEQMKNDSFTFFKCREQYIRDNILSLLKTT